MIRLAFVTSGNPNISASARFRVYQFLPYFEDLRFVAITGTVVFNRKLGTAALIIAVIKMIYLGIICDVMLVQKVRFPRPILRLLTMLTYVVYDFDDSNFLPPPSWNSRNDFAPRRDRLEYCLRHSHQVIAGNEYLADYARQFSQRVIVIPTVVTTSAGLPADHYRWGVPAQIYLPKQNEESDGLTIGWIGQGEHIRQLDQVLNALRTLQNTHSVCVKVVSSHQWLPDGLSVVNKTWVLQEEVADVQSFDIGVMPLNAQDPFLKGKCAFKAIEYMAVGIPVVATSVGANKKAIIHGETGYLVEKPEDWELYLTRLIVEEDLRREMGRNGRRWIEAQYSLDATLPSYIELLTQMPNRS